jgi:V/A-type H+-transporting ATPase subunit I
MRKVRLVAIRSVSHSLLSELHRMGMVEVRRFESEGFESGKPVELYDSISSELSRVRSMKSVLGLGDKSSPPVEMAPEEALSLSGGIGLPDGLREKRSQIENNESKISFSASRLKDAKKLSKFSADFSNLASSTLTFSVGELPYAKLAALRKLLGGYGIEHHRAGDSAVFAIAYPQGDSKVEDAFGKCGVSLVDTEGFTTPEKTVHSLNSEISRLKRENASLEAEVSAAALKLEDGLLRAESALSLCAERTLITKEMGFGSQTMILEGWIKESDLGKLKNTLTSKFSGKAYLETVSTKEEPPVVLNNPESSHPFQFLVELFSLPKAAEIDPTLVLLITIPIIYGMMLGDVFYGVISFLLANWIVGKMKKGGLGYGVASIWKFSAISGIIFGLIFDEWLGTSSYHLLQILGEWGVLNLTAMGITGPLYAGFSRSHQVSLLIGMSILLGVVHLALGFFLGAVNEWNHNRKHAIGKLAWIFIEIGGVIAIMSLMFAIFPESVGFAGLGILMASIAVVAFTEGPIGLIELPGLVGNVLSYARIAAVGLVGVLLAELINDAFIPLPDQGLFYAILMVPILLLFHVLNIGLAMVECLVQGGRLNLVEFYSKFFHGGGKEFTPFMMGVKPKQ